MKQDFSNKQKAISKYVTLRQNILTIADKKNLTTSLKHLTEEIRQSGKVYKQK